MHTSRPDLLSSNGTYQATGTGVAGNGTAASSTSTSSPMISGFIESDTSDAGRIVSGYGLGILVAAGVALVSNRR